MAQRGNAGQSRARAKAQAENSRRRKKRRRGRRTLHFTALILFLIAAGAVLSFTVFFKIEEVRVVGTDKYSPDEVAAATGIQKEDNLLRIDKAAITEKLLGKYPYIESVEIRRKLPPAVEVIITQAQPEAAIPQGDQVVLINREGKVLERGILLVPDNIPLVKGISVTGVAPGGYLKEEETEKLGMLRYLLEAMDETGFHDITNVDLTDTLNMRVMYENRIQLELGTEAELAYKLLAVMYVLENNIGPDESGTLDVTGYKKSRVLFKPSLGGAQQNFSTDGQQSAAGEQPAGADEAEDVSSEAAEDSEVQ